MLEMLWSTQASFCPPAVYGLVTGPGLRSASVRLPSKGLWKPFASGFVYVFHTLRASPAPVVAARRDPIKRRTFVKHLAERKASTHWKGNARNVPTVLEPKSRIERGSENSFWSQTAESSLSSPTY